MSEVSKICFARVDRIGDLVLTLPCEEIWKKQRPHDEIHWLIEENLSFLPEHAVPKISASDTITVTNSKSFFEEIKLFFALRKILKSKGFDEVVEIHVPWWVAAAFYFAGVKRRHGVASQWFSWLFFNHRLRQRRSLATQHESQYNFDLISFSLGETARDFSAQSALLKASSFQMSKWSDLLSQKKINLKKMVVVHAGMGGSARNWPAPSYKKLIEKMIAQNISVVLTGGAMDRGFLQTSDILNIPGVVSLLDQTKSDDLLAVLSLAKTVVAPSTGVAHLAASLGIPTAALFSPVLVQAPLRWRPIGKAVKVFVPQVDCPGKRSCLGPACRHFDCMEQIQVDSVLAYVMDNL